MIVLRYTLMALGILGAIFTFPNSVMNPFTLVCLGFMALAWFSRNIGKPKEAPGTVQSTQAASSEPQ